MNLRVKLGILRAGRGFDGQVEIVLGDVQCVNMQSLVWIVRRIGHVVQADVTELIHDGFATLELPRGAHGDSGSRGYWNFTVHREHLSSSQEQRHASEVYSPSARSNQR